MLTLTEALHRNAQVHCDKIAILDEEAEFTWSETVDRVAKAAGLLRNQGINRGDRYAILALNSFRQAELIYAGYWMGATAVPVNFRLAAPEIRDILDDADCKLLAIDPEFDELLQSPVMTNWGGQYFYLCEKDKQFDLNYEVLIDSAVAIEAENTQEEDEAILLYTGGTTGKSKGVSLTHKNILSNARQIGSVWTPSVNDVALHLPPMCHSADLVKTIYMLNGAANVYLGKFDPKSLLQTIEKFHVNFLIMVPTIIKMIIQSDLVVKYDLSSLKRLLYGTSPMPAPWIKKTFQAFPGVEIVQGYGLTETSPLLSILDHQSHIAALETENYERLASCGRPLDGIEISIVSDKGEILPTGSKGNIVVRGDNVFNGYLNNPEINMDIFSENGFNTGDVGELDEDGFLYLRDRKHDIIITGGENVYPSEVETVIYQFPDVAECAVIGIPDSIYGERVHAVVVASPGKQLDESDLLDHCRKQIGGYKLPGKIDIVDQLPKNTLGKTLKTELRKKYAKAF